MTESAYDQVRRMENINYLEQIESACRVRKAELMNEHYNELSVGDKVQIRNYFSSMYCGIIVEKIVSRKTHRQLLVSIPTFHEEQVINAMYLFKVRDNDYFAI